KPRDRSVNFSTSILPPGGPLQAARHETSREGPRSRQIWEGGTRPASPRKSLVKALRDFGLFLAFVLGLAAFGQGKGRRIAQRGLRRAGRRRLAALLQRTLLVLGCLLGLVLRLLGRGRGHDAVIMFRMLKVIFGHYPVAGGIGVPRQLQIFLI